MRYRDGSKRTLVAFSNKGAMRKVTGQHVSLIRRLDECSSRLPTGEKSDPVVDRRFETRSAIFDFQPQPGNQRIRM